MIADRSNNTVILRLTVEEACLVALALDGCGGAIDERCTPLARVLYPSRTAHGVVTSDELDAVAQSAPSLDAEEEVAHA